MKKITKKIIVSLLLIATVVTGVFVLGSCGIDFDYCQHVLEEVEKTEASCMKVGKKTAYECKKCGQLFAYGYLNGKDGEKGLYPIEWQEMSDYANHKFGDFYGDLNSKMTTFDASSLEDFTVWSHCSEDGCGEAFEVESQYLIPFAPSSNTNGSATYVNAEDGSEKNTNATRFAIPAGTASGKCIQIYTTGKNPDNALTAIPFSANTDRHVILFFHNDGNQDINIRYGAEFYSERVGVDVTVPAGGYATAYFNLNITQSNKDCYHELYINSDIESALNLTINGYYFNDAKLQNIKITEYPQIEYAVGEIFDPTGIKVTAQFGEVTRNIDIEDCTFLLKNNKPITEALTAEDNTVYLIYKNKQVKFEIKVQRFEQTISLNGATFADGGTSKVMDRNAIIPAEITASNGKTISYLIDQYGAKYVPGESKVPAYNVNLFPVYEGVTYSDNYALGKEVTVSSTSHGGQKNKLVDGNHGFNYSEDDRWSSNSNYDTATPDEADREWVTINLGEVKSISRVLLYPRKNGAYFPEAYQILVSEDNEHWTPVVTVEQDDLASKNGLEARWHSFSSVNAQYVKVVATKMTNDFGGSWGYIFQLSEIEIYGEVSAN